MQKLVGASLILMVLMSLQTKAFAAVLECDFRSGNVPGVESIQISEDAMIINNNLAVPLSQSRVNCAHFGKQIRLDGLADGYQVILKSCTSEAKYEGHLIDAKMQRSAKVYCDEI